MADYSAELHGRFGPGVPAETDAAESEILRQVLRRRTHRPYAPRAVPASLVRMLCLAALSASSKSDFQQASIIEVTDPQKRAALATPFPDMPHVGTSPAFLVFCGDARRRNGHSPESASGWRRNRPSCARRPSRLPIP